MFLRSWLKHHLPYPLTCAISELINPPMLAQEQRSERLTEYSWVLHQMGKHHPTGGRILDFGYAGSYFAEALCQFGQVMGCDLRRTPEIRHPNFHHVGELPRGDTFDTIVCLSVLEHYLDADSWVRRFMQQLAPGGQVLITVPTGHPQHFRGYRTYLPSTILAWPGQVTIDYFHRTARGWLAGAGFFPDSTEHQVNVVACVRITNRDPGSQPTDSTDPTPDSAAQSPSALPDDNMGLGGH